ncbi:MAG: class I SAM-dependent methyltransferase [Parcubacteria group bacterium]|nr:class I SAM-dependent methyltransferase [Parcubacteria group bacterium]
MTKFNTELIKIYKNAPVSYKLYIAIRNAICPLYDTAQYVPKDGKIVDFGCGQGLFANILAMQSGKRYVIGIDIMPDRIKVARGTLTGKRNIEFRIGNIEHGWADKDVKCVTLMDILCYVPFEKKKEILSKIYNCLPASSMLVIKSIQERPLLKYWLTLFHMATIDKLMHRCFEKNAYFLKKKEYIDLLKDVGFKVDFRDVGRGYPYPHCLYICNKTSEKRI